MSTEEDIKEALTPTVRAAGLEIWDVERSGASVRVLVERPGGVDLDAISELSGAVSAVLDNRDDLVPAGRYMLEVSSPGLERRLRYPAHFARCIGEEVAVKTAEPFLGSRRLTGTLVGATEEAVTVRVGADGPASDGPASDGPAADDLVQIPLPAIERAHLVFKWPAASRTGSRGHRGQREARAHRGASPEVASPEVASPEVASSPVTGGEPWQE